MRGVRPDPRPAGDRPHGRLLRLRRPLPAGGVPGSADRGTLRPAPLPARPVRGPDGGGRRPPAGRARGCGRRGGRRRAGDRNGGGNGSGNGNRSESENGGRDGNGGGGLGGRGPAGAGHHRGRNGGSGGCRRAALLPAAADGCLRFPRGVPAARPDRGDRRPGGLPGAGRGRAGRGAAAGAEPAPVRPVAGAVPGAAPSGARGPGRARARSRPGGARGAAAPARADRAQRGPGQLRGGATGSCGPRTSRAPRSCCGCWRSPAPRPAPRLDHRRAPGDGRPRRRDRAHPGRAGGGAAGRLRAEQVGGRGPGRAGPGAWAAGHRAPSRSDQRRQRDRGLPGPRPALAVDQGLPPGGGGARPAAGLHRLGAGGLRQRGDHRVRPRRPRRRRTFHLTHPEPPDLARVFAAAEHLGYRLRTLPADQWRAAVAARHDNAAQLFLGEDGSGAAARTAARTAAGAAARSSLRRPAASTPAAPPRPRPASASARRR